MVTAFSQRFYVMHLLHRNKPSVLKALLTQRMFFGIGITDAFPGSAVTVSCGRVSAVAFVLLRRKLFVFLAVSFVCQSCASGVGTGMLWFLRHLRPPFLVITKALRDFSPKARLILLSADYTIS